MNDSDDLAHDIEVIRTWAAGERQVLMVAGALLAQDAEALLVAFSLG